VNRWVHIRVNGARTMSNPPEAHISPPVNEGVLPGQVILPAMGMFTFQQKGKEDREVPRFPRVMFFEPTTDAIPSREGWLNTMSQVLGQAINHAAGIMGITTTAPIPTDQDDHHAMLHFDITVAPTNVRRCVGLCRSHHGHENKARIQICPSIECPIEVAHILLHEMVHAFTQGHGHRGNFTKIMKFLDSNSPMTATTAGDAQSDWLTIVLQYFPEWSDVHKPFLVTPRGKRGKGSRMIKVGPCPNCECVFRLSKKWLDMCHWEPCCPVCGTDNIGVEE
jgi:hypothetical protein